MTTGQPPHIVIFLKHVETDGARVSRVAEQLRRDGGVDVVIVFVVVILRAIERAGGRPSLL
jgi:hypothetical protein